MWGMNYSRIHQECDLYVHGLCLPYDCEVSILGDTQKLSRDSPGQLALGDSAWTGDWTRWSQGVLSNLNHSLIHSMKTAAILNHIQGKWVTNFRLLFDATAMMITWDNQMWHVVKSTAKLQNNKLWGITFNISIYCTQAQLLAIETSFSVGLALFSWVVQQGDPILQGTFHQPLLQMDN